MLNLLPCDGEVFLFPDFLDSQKADSFFTTILKETPWRQDPIVLFGKKFLQPRLTSWHGDPDAIYTYSRLKLLPLPWTPTLLSIKQEIENFSQTTFNSVLLNYYRNQNDSMGWHQDDEKELGQNPVIASLSLGASRRFLFRHKFKKGPSLKIELEPNSLLLMMGSTQHFWQHALPKQTSPKLDRLNLTFRRIYVLPE